MSQRPRIVFLDRDGTLIASDLVGGVPVATNIASAVRLLPGVAEGCASLKALGYKLVVVTNQPDVPRGRACKEDVTAINARLAGDLDLDLVMTCFHDNSDDCPCRKPRPGMLLEAAERLGVSLSNESVMVGDRWRDVVAGQLAGVSTILVGDGYGESDDCRPDATVEDFASAVQWIRARESGRT